MTSREKRKIILTFVITLIVALTVSAIFITKQENDKRDYVEKEAATQANILKYTVDTALLNLDTLSELVLDEKGEVGNFEAVSRRLMEKSLAQNAISSLQLAPDGVVTKIYPEAGNEAGKIDLFKDPDRKTEAEWARDTGNTTLAGPYELLQGSYCAVARKPVYLGNEQSIDTFWGFVVEILNMEETLEPAHLDRFVEKGYEYKLWRKDPKTGEKTIIVESEKNNLKAPVRREIRMPNVTWYFDVAPEEGWVPVMNVVRAIILSLLISIGMATLVCHNIQNYKRSRMREKNEFIKDVLNNINCGAIVYKVEGDEFIPISVNRTLLDVFSCSEEDVLKTGKKELFSVIFDQETADELLHKKDIVEYFDRNFEAEIETGEGKAKRWFIINLKNSINDKGEIIVYVSLTDIEAEKRAEEKAQTDSMTGLLNKSSFIEKTERIIENGGILFMLDVDDFKKVNDVLGHKCGDDLLLSLAGNLKKIFRSGDLIGRFGGDEFMVFVPEPEMSNDTIRNKVEQIENVVSGGVSAPVLAGVTVSLGIMRIEAGKYVDFMPAFVQVDEALYHSKNAGKNTYTLVNEDGLSCEEVIITSDVVRENWSEIIAAMNKAHFCNYFLDLNTEHYTVIEASEDSLEFSGSEGDVRETFARLLNTVVKPASRPKMEAFLNLDTLKERLKCKESVECEYESINRKRWCRPSFIVVSRDEDGYPAQVLYMNSSLDEEKKKEMENRAVQEMQRQAYATVADAQIMMLGDIDIESETVTIKQCFNQERINQVYSLEGLINREAGFVVPAEREWYRANMAVEKILRSVEQYGRYEMSANRFSEAGGEKFVKNYFVKYEGKEGHILCIVEDATGTAIHDNLTKELNMSGFERYLKYFFAQKREGRYAILNFNILNFKAINSSRGFDEGDRILKSVSRKLKMSALAPLVLCREFSDDFFCLVRSDELEESLVEDVCSMNISIGGSNVLVQLRCGIYEIPNIGDFDVQVACDKARLARKGVSRLMGNNCCIFTEEMNKTYIDSATILTEIRNAVEERQYEVYYQVIVDAASGSPVSAEALVRWNHPVRGIMSPGMFLPVLEQEGRVAEVDLYMDSKVRAFQQARKSAGKSIIPVSLNLSRGDLFQPDVMKELEERIAGSELDAGSIGYEITEHGFSDIPQGGTQFINKVRNLGASVYLDDFGSGYSSLINLTERDFDILKLDMSFVQNIGRNKKAEAIILEAIRIAHAMGIKIIAEGVETEEQYRYLAENGCDMLQGYFFSKPVPQSEFEELLDRQG